MISEHVNWRKVGLYLVFAFGISWTSALIAYASGIPLASVPGIVVLALTYMPAPAVAAWIVQKKIFGGTLGAYGLRLRGTRLRGLLASIAVVWLLALGTLGLVSLALAGINRPLDTALVYFQAILPNPDRERDAPQDI